MKNKIVVLCDKEHDICASSCAFCKIEELERIIMDLKMKVNEPKRPTNVPEPRAKTPKNYSAHG